MVDKRDVAGAAETYANAVDYLHGPRRRAARDGFIAGADLMAETVIDLQAKLDAMTGERNGWRSSAAEFAQSLHDERNELTRGNKRRLELAEKVDRVNVDNARLEKERDDWHHAYDRLVSDIVHGRPFTFDRVDPSGCRTFPDAATFAEAVASATVTHCGVDPAAPGSDRTVIAVCKAYERAMDDMGSLGTGVMVSEATGGFTATGEAAADPRADNGEKPSAWYPGNWTAETFAPEKGEAGHSDQVRDLMAQLAATEGYMKFYKALAASRARSSAELSKMIDDLLNLGA